MYAVETPEDHWELAYANTNASRTFASVAAKLQHDRQAIEHSVASMSAKERQVNYQAQAQAAIQELLPVANLPHYTTALRALHEVRRELAGIKHDRVAKLRRNLDLFLDANPEGVGAACNSSSQPVKVSPDLPIPSTASGPPLVPGGFA